MKSMILTAVFLMGTSAWACPDLSGKFSCANGDSEPIVLTVTQRVEEGVTIYTLVEDTAEFIADGNWHSEVGQDYIYMNKVTCGDDNRVHVESRMTFGEKGSDGYMKIDSFIQHWINADGHFQSYSTGTREDNEKSQSYTHQETCNRV